MKQFFVCVFALCALCCGNPTPDKAASEKSSSARDVLRASEPVTPPFELRGEAEGLLLVWYDGEGAARPAQKRSDIPEDERGEVRVDSLDVAPDKRLDPAYVYVADLRAAGSDGRYPVRKVLREAFESAMAKPAEQLAAGAGNDVIIYGASWCGACKQAAQYLTQKGVPFVEKDIEKEPGARSEMVTKAKAQGVSTSGIPVIDVRGTLLGGFDPERIERLLAKK